MKKIVCIAAACLLVAGLSTSCNKNCTCKTYAAGVVVTTTENVELDRDSYKKCSDMNTVTMILDKKTGIECY